MRKSLVAVATLFISLTGSIAVAVAGTAGAAQASGQGVTAGTIKVGVTYPDVAAISKVINVDPGNYQVAYSTLFNRSTQTAVSTAARSSPRTPRSTPLAPPERPRHARS